MSGLEGSVHKPAGLHQDPSIHSAVSVDGSAGNNGYHSQQQQQQRGMVGHEEGDSQPIHFVYDKDSVPAAASRDANAAWQMYSDQMAQAMAATGNPNMDYGMTEEGNTTTATSSSSTTKTTTTTVAPTDRLSAMAMWRSTTLPDPLPTPHYSDSVTRARESGNTMSARPKIIRETTQFFLALKLWWTAPDYERIAELVLKNFPALVSLQAIKKDLGTCARNMRRRLPAAKYKPSSSQAQKAAWSSSGGANNAAAGCGSGMETTQGLDAGGSGVQSSPAEYMKALMAAQGMNLSELGMSQRNLGELAVLAGIKQRIEQHPTEVSDLERQYLAQCTTEERQALLTSGAFGNDSTAMAALSAFYGQLGVDISSGSKRSQDYPPSSTSAVGVSSGMPDGGLGELLVVPNKRQRRISQAEVEKRLREAELNHVNQQGQHHLHHFQQLQQQQQHLENVPKSSHQGTVAVNITDKHLVKREPTSPTGVEGLKNRQQQHNHHHLQSQHHNQHHQHQQLTVPSPVNMSNFAVSTANGMGMAPMSSSSSASSAHDQAYWDSQTATNMALMGLATSVAPLMATQAHSQAQVQHLSGHPHQGLTSSHNASHEVPMNLTYHEADKTDSPSSQSSHPHHRQLDRSPSVQDPLPDTAGLAAQVEVTTSAVKSPRRRASSSPRSGSQQGDSSLSQRDQVWFPHGQGFKKENQEVVCLPEPLPIPVYSQKIAAAREEGTSMRHRSEIIRETARFFLGLKYWWSSADYTRISELVVQHFPDLKDDSTGDGMNNYRRIQRDLSMCARNLRRSKKPRKMRELSSSDLANSMIVPGEDNEQHHQGPVGETINKKRPSRPKGTLYGAAAERKAKRQAGASAARSKKAKLHQATGQNSSLDATGSAVATSVVGSDGTAVGVTEDMTAAAALMQQQFMQQTPAASSVSSGYIAQHPSAHLLPTAHLMPSLHTHPALHGQHMQQMNTPLLQQEGANINVEEAHTAKRLVKEEPAGSDALDHTHSGIKANMVTPMQRQLSPTLGLEADGQSSAAVAELARQRVLRDMEAGVISREDADKLGQAQVQPASTLKVYVDPDHGSDLQERFSILWRKGKFFDASLGVANKKLHVHKLVLLAMSPYLQETFKNADPRSQLEVNLPSDTTYETAKAFLKYIYEGVLEVDTSSVRSLHKIATMLQMNKLAQYCQNFAQQLQEEAEQALQRLGETQMTSDLQRATRYATEEHLHFKAGYLAEAQQAEAAATQPHFLHQDALAQHRALVAASSPTPSSHQHQQHHHHQQQNAASSELLLSSGGPASAQDLATQHLIQAALVRNQAGSPSSTTVAASSSLYQQQEALSAVGGGVPVSDTNSALLQRLTSPALAAYWQAHTLTELMSRGGVTSDPSNQTSASELAAIAAAAAATTSSSSLPLSTSSEDQRHLGKGGGRGSGIHAPHHHHHHQQAHHHHHQQQQHQQHKESQQWAQHADDPSHHHGSMLPETCLPGELSRGNS
ncbi:zinc finger and BTB domain-containing protein 40 [Elysia marginata]|uniref:Zinc finger and BTB domain-containing protein 40 n=1 Tax=Elysia marginata TaxID=1093978 RepID=A0AAV4F6W3_9GAST|nr:zinc finger and BTB domain-containing protein 40 [Elysia marginata]